MKLERRTCILMAAEMLGIHVDEMPPELVRRLSRIVEMIKRVEQTIDAWDGGAYVDLRSRQVVATVVEQWEREVKER